MIKKKPLNILTKSIWNKRLVSLTSPAWRETEEHADFFIQNKYRHHYSKGRDSLSLKWTTAWGLRQALL